MRILLLDDEDALRELLRDVLEGEGYEVTTASSDRAVLSGAMSDAVDLVVTDVMMPDCDGLEVVRKVRANWPAVKIIAMSGGGRTVSQDYLPIAEKLGADRLLYEPFSPFDLVAEVRSLLGAAATT